MGSDKAALGHLCPAQKHLKELNWWRLFIQVNQILKLNWQLTDNVVSVTIRSQIGEGAFMYESEVQALSSLLGYLVKDFTKGGGLGDKMSKMLFTYKNLMKILNIFISRITKPLGLWVRELSHNFPLMENLLEKGVGSLSGSTPPPPPPQHFHLQYKHDSKTNL